MRCMICNKSWPCGCWNPKPYETDRLSAVIDEYGDPEIMFKAVRGMRSAIMVEELSMRYRKVHLATPFYGPMFVYPELSHCRHSTALICKCWGVRPIDSALDLSLREIAAEDVRLWWLGEISAEEVCTKYERAYKGCNYEWYISNSFVCDALLPVEVVNEVYDM